MLQCLRVLTPGRPSPLVRSRMEEMWWRAPLMVGTWTSAWFMKATSATTDVSTRPALSGASASLDTCCRRMLSLVCQVTGKTTNHVLSPCTVSVMQWLQGGPVLGAICCLECDLEPAFLSGGPHLLWFVYTFTVYYFPTLSSFLSRRAHTV